MKRRLGIVIMIFSLAVQNVMGIPIATDTAFARLKEVEVISEEPLDFNSPISRGEVTSILVKFLGKEDLAIKEANRHPFKDVPKEAGNDIGYLYKEQIIKGMESSKFYYDRNITMKEFAAMLLRGLNDEDLEWESDELFNACNKLAQRGELYIEKAEFEKELNYETMLHLLNSAFSVSYEGAEASYGDMLEVKNVAEKFAKAYFSQDIESVKFYIDKGVEPQVYAENIWTDFQDFELKWDPRKIVSEEPMHVQFQFVVPGVDSVDYLGIELVNPFGIWKVADFFLEK